MNKVYRARAKPFAAAALIAVGALLSADSVAAQTVLFEGETFGCFGAGCDPETGTNVLDGLTYHRTTGFTAITDMGFAGIGGTSLEDSFGHFVLSTTNAVYTGDVFNLLIRFTNPENADNPFTANLTGTVTQAGNGIFINFTNNELVPLGGTSALYSVAVNDLSVTAGATGGSYVTGRVEAESAVPEPISMVLLGSGLVGLGVVRRRRTKVEQAD